MRSRPVDPDVVSLSVANVEKMIQQDDDWVTEWPSDRVTEWPSDRVTEWPSAWVTWWQEASQEIDHMVYFEWDDHLNIVNYSGFISSKWFLFSMFSRCALAGREHSSSTLNFASPALACVHKQQSPLRALAPLKQWHRKQLIDHWRPLCISVNFSYPHQCSRPAQPSAYRESFAVRDRP